MYAALLKEKLVTAVAEARFVYQRHKQLNAELYRCPHCRQAVILVLSEAKQPFFRHLRQLSPQKGENWEHHESKMLLQSALTAAGFKARCEVELAQGNLRADVLAAADLAFEVQCAPLSQIEYQHRHALYRREKVQDIWVVGKRHYLQKQLKSTQLIFFRQNASWGSYYLEILPAQQRLRLKYNVTQACLSRRLHYQVHSFCLDEYGLQQFWHFHPYMSALPFSWTQERIYLKKQLQTKSKLGQQIGYLLYQKHLTVADLPENLFQKSRRPGGLSPIINFLTKEKTPLK